MHFMGDFHTDEPAAGHSVCNAFFQSPFQGYVLSQSVALGLVIVGLFACFGFAKNTLSLTHEALHCGQAAPSWFQRPLLCHPWSQPWAPASVLSTEGALAPTSQAGLQGFAASCLRAPKSSFCLTLRFSTALDVGVAATPGTVT